MSGDFLRGLRRAGTAWAIGAAVMVCGLDEVHAQASRTSHDDAGLGVQASGDKSAKGSKELSAKETSELAAAANRSLQELEAMGYFAAEGNLRKQGKLSVLEQYYKKLSGEDASSPLAVTGDVRSNYQVSRDYWSRIARTNQAFAKAWNLLDEAGGMKGDGEIELRHRGTLPYEKVRLMDGSDRSYPRLFEILAIKSELDEGGPEATLNPRDEARLRELKASVDARLVEYRTLADAYKTVIACLDAADGRAVRRNALDVLGNSSTGDRVPRAKEASEPPEKLVLRAMEVGSRDRAQCQTLLEQAGLKKYPPALFNLYVGHCFGYFTTGFASDGDPVAAANYRRLWLEADGSSAALQAIAEGYLAGTVEEMREFLVALSAHDEMGLNRTVSTPEGQILSADERERAVLAADYRKETFSLEGATFTERLTLSNYRIIFEGRGWLPQGSVPGNTQRLSYGVNVSVACTYFEKAAWKAVANLRKPKTEKERELRVLKRSLEVIGNCVNQGKWHPSADSKLAALANELSTLDPAILKNSVPEVFQSAVGRVSKQSDDDTYLKSLGIQK